MKIGYETGSLVNALISSKGYVCPKVGMDVTECHWSDRSAWKIIEVDEDLKGFLMVRYKPVLVGDYYSQNYRYEDEQGKPLLNYGHKIHVRYRYKSWRNGGIKLHLSFGRRDEYEDPSF